MFSCLDLHPCTSGAAPGTRPLAPVASLPCCEQVNQPAPLCSSGKWELTERESAGSACRKWAKSSCRPRRERERERAGCRASFLSCCICKYQLGLATMRLQVNHSLAVNPKEQVQIRPLGCEVWVDLVGVLSQKRTFMMSETLSTQFFQSLPPCAGNSCRLTLKQFPPLYALGTTRTRERWFLGCLSV